MSYSFSSSISHIFKIAQNVFIYPTDKCDQDDNANASDDIDADP